MKPVHSMAAAAASVIVACTAPDFASSAETLEEALKETKYLMNVRVRQENVEQDGFEENAEAFTARVRAGIQTGDWRSTSLLAEIVVSDAIVADYNSTINGNTQYPVVADPDDIDAINRFAITNRSLEKTTLTFGRQRIVLDDSRFVGNVGWRQNEQTYDGLRAVIGGDERVKFDVSYINQVNRIFGPDSPSGKFNGDIVLANVSKELDIGTLTGFVYSLDLDQAAALSTNTIGLRLTGAKAFARTTGLYEISYANQTDTGDNATDLSESYVKLEGGLRISKATIALGLEQLGGDGTNSVTMPLSTLHAFQGWADKFLATPAAGIDDAYMRFAYSVGSIGPFSTLTLAGFYHELDANEGATHYGDEVDFSINARLERASFTLKYSAYEAAEWATDTDKFWLSMDYAF